MDSRPWRQPITGAKTSTGIFGKCAASAVTLPRAKRIFPKIIHNLGTRPQNGSPTPFQAEKIEIISVFKGIKIIGLPKARNY